MKSLIFIFLLILVTAECKMFGWGAPDTIAAGATFVDLSRILPDEVVNTLSTCDGWTVLTTQRGNVYRLGQSKGCDQQYQAPAQFPPTSLTRFEGGIFASKFAVDAKCVRGESDPFFSFLFDDGTLWVQGISTYCNVFITSTTSGSTPQQMTFGQTTPPLITKIWSGIDSFAAQTSSGDLYIYGNYDYRLGYSSGSNFLLVPFTATEVVDVGLGRYHMLVCGSNGQVYGAGDSDSGELAQSYLTSLSAWYPLPSGKRCSKVFAGWKTSLVVTSDGRYFVNGGQVGTVANSFDGLGLPQYAGGSSALELQLPANILVRDAMVAPVREKHGAAIVFNTSSRYFEVLGWSGKSSALAAISTTPLTSTTIYQMGFLNAFIRAQGIIPRVIRVEDSHSAILTSNGKVFSWSSNIFLRAVGSQITNTTLRTVDPDGVLNSKSIVQLSRSYAEGVPRVNGFAVDVSYALMSDNTIWRWGSTPELKSPTRVLHDIGTVTKIAAGVGISTNNNFDRIVHAVFALTSTGQLYVTGECPSQSYSQCYISSYEAVNGFVPITYQFLPSPPTSIVAFALYGKSFSKGAIVADNLGRLFSWGLSDHTGYIGGSPNPRFTNSTLLFAKHPPPAITNIWSQQLYQAANIAYNNLDPIFFFQDTAGTIYSHGGDNTFGQLCRTGIYGNAQAINSTILAGKVVSNIVFGDGTTYILTQDGYLYGCGRNDAGQLLTTPFTSCPPYYDPSCSVQTPYPVLIAPTATRNFLVEDISVGESLFVIRTRDGSIYGGGKSFSGSFSLKMNSNDPSDILGYGRRLSAIAAGAGGSVNIFAPLEITPNPSLVISTVALNVTFEGNGFGSTSESSLKIVLSGGVPCVVQTRTVRRITCILTSDFNVRPPLVVGPLTATIEYSGETVGPVQIATVVASPVVDPSSTPLSERASTLTISGTGFGTDISSIFAVGCGPVTQVTPTSLTCQITSAISADQGMMRVRVLRNADPNLSARFVDEVAVARLIPSHEVTKTLGTIPANAREIVIVGRGFNGSSSFAASVASESGNSVACQVSQRSDTSFKCSYTGLNAIESANIRISITQAGYQYSRIIGIMGKNLTSSALVSDRSTFASNARLISISGQGLGSADSFSLSVTLRSGYAEGTKKRAQTLFPCSVTFRNDSVLECRPTESLQPGPLVAEFSTDVGVADSLLLGQVVAAPSVDASASFQKLATTATQLRIIGNGFASGSEIDQNSVVFTNFPQKTCTIASVTNTTLTCNLVGLTFPTGLVVQASVSVYGGLAGTFPAAIVVNPPKISASSEKILTGTSTFVIRGEGFASERASSTNSITLRLEDGSGFPCLSIDSQSNDTVITCNATEALSRPGVLTAVVRAYGGASESTVIGLVVEPVAPVNPDAPGVAGSVISAAADPGVIAGAVVAVIVVLVAATLIVVVLMRRRMRLLKNIQGSTINVPEEMASLFNIKSDSLQIIRRLGEGSFGAVFLAKNAQGRMVAVKKLAGSMLASAANDFFREAATMMGIPPHKNVVRTLGLVQEVSNFSLVMEFLPNGALDGFAMKIVHTPGSSWDPIVQYRIILGIARGMAHLASQGIVHRDLAARNVLLSANFEPKISDFGMSRVVGAEQTAQTNANMGPIKWMPPESIGQRTYSEKSDVFSFAVVLYEIVAGCEPYMDMELLQVAVSVRDQGLNVCSLLPTAGSADDFVPEYIRRLMEQCSQFEPANRPTFTEIVHWLEQGAPFGYQELPEEDAEGELEKEGGGKSHKSKRKSEYQANYAPVNVLSEK